MEKACCGSLVCVREMTSNGVSDERSSERESNEHDSAPGF